MVCSENPLVRVLDKIVGLERRRVVHRIDA